jgi:hypothetical protein
MEWREEFAWAAGLFEGEGSITLAPRPRLQMKMADEDVVRRFAEIIGVGKVYGPYGPYDYEPPKRLQKKPTWMWVCEGRRASEALEALRPWLSARRLAQARRVGFLL